MPVLKASNLSLKDFTRQEPFVSDASSIGLDREQAGLNLAHRVQDSWVTPTWSDHLEQLVNPLQWAFVGGLQAVGDLAGWLGYRAGFGRAGQILVDELVSGVVTGNLRESASVWKAMGRDVGEGLGIRLTVMSAMRYFLKAHPLLRFGCQPVVFGGVSFVFQAAFDRLTGEKTVETTASGFLHHMVSTSITLVQGQTTAKLRSRFLKPKTPAPKIALVMADSMGIDPRRARYEYEDLESYSAFHHLTPRLRQDGFEPVVFNLDQEGAHHPKGWNPQELVEHMRQQDIAAIGVSASSQIREATALLTSHLKLATDLPIVLGGTLADVPGAMGRLPGVDVLCHGEANFRVGDIFKGLLAGDPSAALAKVPGLTLRDGAQVTSTGERLTSRWQRRLWPEVCVDKDDAGHSRVIVHAVDDLSLRQTKKWFDNFISEKEFDYVDVWDRHFLRQGKLGAVAASLRAQKRGLKLAASAMDVLVHQEELKAHRDVLQGLELRLSADDAQGSEVAQAYQVLSDLNLDVNVRAQLIEAGTNFTQLKEQVGQLLAVDSNDKASQQALPFAITMLAKGSIIHRIPRDSRGDPSCDPAFGRFERLGDQMRGFDLKGVYQHFINHSEPEKAQAVAGLAADYLKTACLASLPTSFGKRMAGVSVYLLQHLAMLEKIKTLRQRLLSDLPVELKPLLEDLAILEDTLFATLQFLTARVQFFWGLADRFKKPVSTPAVLAEVDNPVASPDKDVALVVTDDYYVDPNSGKNDRGVVQHGIDYLVPRLREQGMDVEKLHPYKENIPPSAIVDRIVASGVRAIGVSAMTQLMQSAALLTSHLKLATGLPIVMGGYVSQDPDVMKVMPGVDVLFKGEGDVRGPQLFQALLKGDGIEDIPGLEIRQAGGQITSTGVAPVEAHIDGFIPDFHLNPTPNHTIAYFYSSRGCYARCNYCDIWTFYKKRLNRMSPDVINEVIADLKKRGVTRIDFTDDDFLYGRPGRLDAIAPALRKAGITISFQTRATDVLRHADEIRRNSDVLNTLDMGVESFSDAQLLRWKKGITAQQNIDAINLLHEAGVPYGIYMITLDRHTTFNELRENLDVYFDLPIGYNHLPTYLQGVSLDRAFAKSLTDVHGASHISEGNERFLKLMMGSQHLNLTEMAFVARDKQDKETWDLALLSAQGFLISGVLATRFDDVGNAAAQDHEALRMMVRMYQRILKDNKDTLDEELASLQEHLPTKTWQEIQEQRDGALSGMWDIQAKFRGVLQIALQRTIVRMSSHYIKYWEALPRDNSEGKVVAA